MRVYDEKYLLFGVVQCTRMKESLRQREKETRRIGASVRMWNIVSSERVNKY